MIKIKLAFLEVRLFFSQSELFENFLTFRKLFKLLWLAG